MEAGRFAAGSSRTGAQRANAVDPARRLDPFSLPVRFTAADEHLCIVDLHRERVVLRRSVRSMRMAVNLPVAAYRGVAIRLSDAIGKPQRSISVMLEHADPGLTLLLFCSSEADEIVAEWQSWSRVLGLPLQRRYVARGRSRGSAACASNRRPGGAGVCQGFFAAASADFSPRPSCIAASAKSSPGTDPFHTARCA